MEKSSVYVISDIHGMFDLMQEALAHWEKETMQLVFIGDLNDRGSKSKDCLYYAMKLVKEHEAIYLRGNHEEMFLRFLEDPERNKDIYLCNGGLETLESFFFKGVLDEYSVTEIVMMLRSQHKELMSFLKFLPTFYEWEQYVFVHAGVDLTKSDWRKSSQQDFVWIRNPFHQGKNETGKVIVFGHTVTPYLHRDGKTTDLWISDNKIGIDGAGVYGGVVHGVLFGKLGIEEDYIFPNKTGAWRPKY